MSESSERSAAVVLSTVGAGATVVAGINYFVTPEYLQNGMSGFLSALMLDGGMTAVAYPAVIVGGMATGLITGRTGKLYDAGAIGAGLLSFYFTHGPMNNILLNGLPDLPQTQTVQTLAKMPVAMPDNANFTLKFS